MTGIRFYKATTNTGTHIGSLWSASGTLLARRPSPAKPPPGGNRSTSQHPSRSPPTPPTSPPTWPPTATTPTPPTGFATAGVSNPPLTALANTISPNGVYAYSTTSTFPTSTYKATNYWVDVDFEPAPAVVTKAASAITQTTASINATVNPNGGTITECEFEYGTTETYGSNAPCTPSPGSGESPVAVSAPLTGLTANTTYHFRVSATSAGGAGHGADQALTTPPNAPTLETKLATAITQTTASLNATANPNGGEVSECALEYSAAAVYELTKSYESSVPCTPSPGSGESPVAVSAPLTGLTANTTYHFRVSATNPGGTSHSKDQTLITLPNAPTVLTAPATVITHTTASLNATVNPNGGTVTECELEYGTTETYESSAPCTPTPGSGESPVAVSAPLTGLTANTTYHFRVSATNPGGTSHSKDQTLTTQGAPEFGRCVKSPAEKEGTKTVYHGDFATATCLVTSETDTGKYNWSPGVLKAHFTTKLTSGSVKLESAVKTSKVTCTGETGAGEYTGLKTVGGEVITLTGCERSAEQCSSGATAGEIVTSTLEGALGVMKLGTSSSKNTIGLDLHPAGNTGPVTEFACGDSSVSVRGSVIVPVSAENMLLTLKQKAKASKGKQVPERFEGGPKDILEESIAGAPFEPVGLTAAIVQTSEEEVEVNSVV